VSGRYPRSRRRTPSNACTPAITWATTTHVQNRWPGSRFAMSAMRPQTHPTVNTPTTANPTYSWTFGIGRGVYGARDRILGDVVPTRRTDVLAAAIVGLFVVPMAAALLLRHDPPVDLAVYLLAGRMFATGGHLYADGWGSVLAHPLPYTYPPLWAALV